MGAIIGKRAGAKPHGQKDKVLLPKKLISAPIHVQSGTDFIGADWERRLAVPNLKKKVLPLKHPFPKNFSKG